ncbi:MAG TPA: TerC family protein [Nitrolancea sp.]|nr:TerC family protein [Nitrolancea sp.]
MNAPIWLWILFNVVVIGLIVLDLGVFHRKVHVESIRESAIWTAIWTLVALAFNAGIYFYRGGEPALSFLSGYVIERALAVDNIFVFMMIFTAFGVPQVLQYRALFWGIIGAIILRAILIATGTVIIERFEWVLYFFGGFLVVTGLRMLRSEEKEIDPGNHPVVRFLRRIVPVTHEYRGARFMIRSKGSLVITPLFVVLAVIAVSDLVFALDSIPAIFAITQDPFLVYTSNILAVLGLQAMFSMLGGIIDKFHLLKYGLAAVLAFVGVKMLIAGFYHLPIALSLGVIVAMLAASIIASRLFPEQPKKETSSPIEMV